MTRHLQHIGAQLAGDCGPVLGLTLLQDELNDVILRLCGQNERTKHVSVSTLREHAKGDARTYAKLINHQPRSMKMQFIQKGTSLLIGKMFEASLQDAAAIRVRC